jgi:membrane protease YdiL (CAAX protease family)
MTTKNSKHDLTLCITGLTAFFIYMVLPNFKGIPFQLLNIDFTSIPIYLRIIYLITFELLLMGIIIFIFKNKIKKDINDMKRNHQKYFSECLKYWLISVAVMIISNLLISIIIPDALPSNEKTIREIFNVSPVYIFFSAVIFAPIVEELVFRLGFRYMFKTNWLFIFMSGLIFGGLHVISSAESFVELLYIIPYAAPGIAFAYILSKTNNILVTIGFHLMHNGILVTLQFLMLILGKN